MIHLPVRRTMLMTTNVSPNKVARSSKDVMGFFLYFSPLCLSRLPSRWWATRRGWMWWSGPTRSSSSSACPPSPSCWSWARWSAGRTTSCACGGSTPTNCRSSTASFQVRDAGILPHKLICFAFTEKKPVVLPHPTLCHLCRDWLPSSPYPGGGHASGGPCVGHQDTVRRSGLPHHCHNCGQAHVQQRQLQPAEDHPGEQHTL